MKVNFHLGLDDSKASVRGIALTFLIFSVSEACHASGVIPPVSHIHVVSDERVVKKNRVF